LKKRTKKLWYLGARGVTGARANVQKFFASFFKKEGLPYCLPTTWRRHDHSPAAEGLTSGNTP
jgi:hypothetical protein